MSLILQHADHPLMSRRDIVLTSLPFLQTTPEIAAGGSTSHA